MEELYTLTLKREQCIRSLGFEHMSIWEHEFNKLLRENETAANFVKSLDLQMRLDPRIAFLGARVNSMKLHYAVNDVEKSTISISVLCIPTSTSTPGTL